MADYTAATNLISWVPAQNGVFGWPSDAPDAAKIEAMKKGDLIAPKFAQSPVYEGDFDQVSYIKGICARFSDDYEARRAEYEQKVAWGHGAVPFIMRVDGDVGRDDSIPNSEPWICVPVELLWLDHPLSTTAFLKLRVVPLDIAGQYKAMAAPGKRIQRLPAGAGDLIRTVGSSAERSAEHFRTQSLVRADTPEAAAKALADAGLPVLPGDRAFLIGPESMQGLARASAPGTLELMGTPIETSPQSLRGLFEKAKAAPKTFKAQRPLMGADELVAFLNSKDQVKVVDEFSHFHDRFVLMATRVNEAHDALASSGKTGSGVNETTEDDDDSAEVSLIHQVEGLAISAVRNQLPPGMAIDDAVLAEAVTALRAGKHLMLAGPPGTGKSTLAGAICAAVDVDYRTATATADWSTVDTIGAYLPDPNGGLTFEPGLILGCLAEGAWLVVDEINRADIDKAFGPMFSLLAGAGGAVTETVTLPYTDDGKRIEVGWAETREAASTPYAVTRSWRLIGTMNDSDKASLFGLSFAFLRRFAVIDVGLPPEAAYRELVEARLPSDVAGDQRQRLLEAAMRIAHGPIALGPAIMLDVAEFTRRGVTATNAGQPYSDVVDAFISALRLYVVPQYEGAEPGAGKDLRAIVTDVWPQAPIQALERFSASLERASISGQL